MDFPEKLTCVDCEQDAHLLGLVLSFRQSHFGTNCFHFHRLQDCFATIGMPHETDDFDFWTLRATALDSLWMRRSRL